MNEECFDRGAQLLGRLYGEDYQKVLKKMDGIAPDFGRFIVEFAAGSVYCRPQLDLRSREIVAMASLATLGFALPQLKVHVAGALNAGCTKEEVVEVLMQVAVHAGFPAARNALWAAAEVFSDREMASAVPKHNGHGEPQGRAP